MKKVFTVLIAVLTVIFASEALANPINSDGTFRGIKLWGKVRVVDAFGDVKVKVVDSFADLRVQKVDAFADSLGKWQFVSFGEDFTVEFVDSFADIKIKFVDAFPGF